MPCKHEGGTDPCKLANRQCAVNKKRYRATPARRKWDVEYEKTRAGVPGGSGAGAGAVGAASELIAAADLMVKGFPVTRPLNPSATHDLHVELPSVGWVGVQVKTAQYNKNAGTWRIRQRGPRRSPVYVWVLPLTKEVRYEAGSEPLPAELK